MSTPGDMMVLVDFQGQQEDELNIKAGEIIRNVKKTAEDGWLEGEINGKRGLFPKIFAKEIPSLLLNNNGQQYPRSIRKVNACIQKKKQRWCRADYAYNPGKPDELDLCPGEIIEVLEEIEDGWWLGKKGNLIGAFPSNFVQEIAESPSDMVLDLKKNNKQRPKMKEFTFVPKDEEKVNPPDNPTVNNQKVKEFCRVMFDYVPTMQDELGLKKGDVISIISKDTEDEGWWRGELNGKTGFFPDNFVMLLPPTSEFKTSKPPTRTLTLKRLPKMDISTTDKKVLVVNRPDSPSSSNQKDKVDTSATDKKRPDVKRPESPSSLAQKGAKTDISTDKKVPDVNRPESPASIGQKDKKIPDMNTPQSPPSTSLKDRKDGKADPAPKMTNAPGKKSAPPPPVPVKNKSSPTNKPSAEPQTKPVEESKEAGKTNTLDGLKVSSVKLAHPTAERPKVQGKRPPKTKVILPENVGNPPEHVYKKEEEEESKSPTCAKVTPKLFNSSGQAPSPTSKASTQFPSVTSASKKTTEAVQNLQVEELAAEIKLLKTMMEIMKNKHTKDMEDIRSEISNEQAKRLALQMEVENLKKLSSS
ncbi:SH3 domain-containing protein 21 isoform X2 [Spea bombifrons]|uniref:SH3 domain-containing protein 21 isoform X2 n=1 Tax=Spea bombifrons TaxID=233779 RepID=UPI00234BAFCD|nr:SH3 domain-containing protein 21 isoform X2 [Spea bombifrons]